MYMKAGIIFFAIWLVIMLFFGWSKNIKADKSVDVQYQRTGGYGHPLDVDY